MEKEEKQWKKRQLEEPIKRLGTWIITECINSRAAAAYIEGRLWPI
jgi:hypothetical protein